MLGALQQSGKFGKMGGIYLMIVHYHFNFSMHNKKGGWNKSGGLENFQQLTNY